MNSYHHAATKADTTLNRHSIFLQSMLISILYALTTMEEFKNWMTMIMMRMDNLIFL